MGLGLEKYKGTRSRFTCPSCGSRNCFVRYVGNDGSYLAEDVGRCNRESKCGYHKKPKDFFLENPNKSKVRNRSQVQIKARIIPAKPDYLEKKYLIQSLENHEQNAFVQFLLRLFPGSSENVWQVVKDYFVGTTNAGETVFWYVDLKGKICKGKILRYDKSTGKRSFIKSWVKDGETIGQKADSIQSRLKKKGLLKDDFETNKQVFFGEHLLRPDQPKPIAIVEAEKTAVLGSICFPEFVWLAVGSKQSLKANKLKRLGKHKIILYPDADGFDAWQKTAFEARLQRADVQISSLIERRGTDSEKANQFDLADYLINEQRKINLYNAKLEMVLNDEKLYSGFETILEEQKAVLMIDGNLSDREAESRIMDFENLREIVLSV